MFSSLNTNEAISVIWIIASFKIGKGSAVFKSSAAYWQKKTSDLRASKLRAKAFIPL